MITRIIIFLSINVYISPKDKNIKVSLIPKHHKTKHHKKVIRSVNIGMSTTQFPFENKKIRNGLSGQEIMFLDQ